MKRLTVIALLLFSGFVEACVGPGCQIPLVPYTWTTAPATCQIGQLGFKSNASAGSNIYGCTAANTWTAQAGGGGSMTWPSGGAGIPLYSGSSSWGTSYSSATPIPPTIGGSGVSNNVASTVTISGAYSLTETLTGATNVTFPTSGTLLSTATATAFPTVVLGGIPYGTSTSGAGGFGISAAITGLVLGNGTSAPTAAVASNVYALWSGTCNSSTYLRGDGSCQALSGSGTVTSASVVSANGFAGTVNNPTTTPAITLTTSISGPIKGSSSALAAAAAADIYGLWSGACSSSTYLRGDGSCQTPSGAGTVTHTVGALTSNAFITGNGGADVQALALTGIVVGNGSSAPSAASSTVPTGTTGTGNIVLSVSPTITGSAITFTSGTARSLANAAEVIICTSTCTITPPGSATAGMQFCVQNADNGATVITLAAVSGVQYENTARTSYKTANTALASGGAVGDQICMIAISATQWNVFGFKGTWS